MDDAERRSAKRSRFDQTEPEPRRSRFDRRSRSPPARKPDSGRDRERSPISGSRDSAPADSKPKSPPVDPAAAAGELASAQPPTRGLVGRGGHCVSDAEQQPPPPRESTRRSRPARASSTSMFPRSDRVRPPTTTMAVLRRVAASSTAKCTSRTAITSRTSRSTTCGTDTCSPRARLRKW